MAEPVLQILFVPFPSPGHIIPMIDIAKLFASHGAAECTIVLTPLNASRFGPTISRIAFLGHLIKLHVLPFPVTSLLPPNCESTDLLPDRFLSEPFGRAVDMLQTQFDPMVRSSPPDAIVSDLLLPWTASVSRELGIARYVFPGTGCFPLSVMLSVSLNRAQIGLSERFVVPGIPDRVHLTQAKLMEATLPGDSGKEFSDRAREADLSTSGLLVNSFSELEPGYKEHYERMTGKLVWLVGPVALCNKDPADVAERGIGIIPPNLDTIFDWLEMKPAGSVLYVCFGSLSRFPLVQLKEIGFGLEESRVPFLWVIKDGEEGSRDEWLEELEGRVEGRGLVVRGWVPQIGILSHVVVGGFMTHCGWGSTTEAAAAGVPMLTWPLFAEQFYNEVLVTEVTGIGSKVGAKVGFVWGEEGGMGVVVAKEKVKEKVIWLMGDGEDVSEVRRKAREMSEKARSAVEIGGSSYESIGMVIEDMRRHRGSEISPDQLQVEVQEAK